MTLADEFHGFVAPVFARPFAGEGGTVVIIVDLAQNKKISKPSEKLGQKKDPPRLRHSDSALVLSWS